MKIHKNIELNDIISYCICKTGARLFGGCSHSVAILYFLVLGEYIILKNEESFDFIYDIKEFKEKKRKKKEKIFSYLIFFF